MQNPGLTSLAARPAAERNRGKMTAESDREFQRMLKRLHAAEEWNAIQIAFRIGIR